MTLFALSELQSGLSGLQSALAPKGPKAAAIFHLNWFLVITATVVYVVVIGVLLYALRRASTRGTDVSESVPQEVTRERTKSTWVLAATELTALILLLFLVVDVSAARSLAHVGGPSPLRIDIVGHQWWWEVKYPDDENPQNTIETANEIHVPVGRAVLMKLTSDDVIHSFWAPNLDGKRDLVPGHVTTTWFSADTAGVYRGQCAEFCGHQHANMSFYIVAEPRADFGRWLVTERASASQPTDSLAGAGERVFLSRTCAMCHSINGTGAGSNFGPNLTHLASRRTIASGTLPNKPEFLAGWILDPQGIKPGVKMPATRLQPSELQALVAYLGTLK